MLIICLLVDDCRAKRGSRRKMRKQNSKVLFHTNSKQADYYMNADVNPVPSHCP